MRRREFIKGVAGSAAAWPLGAHAQQSPAQTIGWLSLRAADTDTEVANLTAFRQGLNQTGYVESKNLTIEFRHGGGRYDALPELAADLVRRRVAVIVTSGGGAVARVVQAATSTIPIVFASASDPVREGIVKSINRRQHHRHTSDQRGAGAPAPGVVARARAERQAGRLPEESQRLDQRCPGQRH